MTGRYPLTWPEGWPRTRWPDPAGNKFGNIGKIGGGGWRSCDNVWLGATVINQEEADRDIPKLLAQSWPAKRFLSIEPMLGPIIVPPGLDWIICGGESGPGARPMHPDWARDLRDQCQATSTAFFFKQWGEWGPDDGPLPDGKDPIMDGRVPAAWFDGTRWHFAETGFDIDLQKSQGCGAWVYRLGKTRAGRSLDGRTWDEMPNPKEPAHG